MSLGNVCSKCGKKIRIHRPKDRYLQQVLENSRTAICNECDPASAWMILELEKIFNEKGYEIQGNIIRAFMFTQLGFPTITIRWKNGKTTLLSVKEIKEKAWRKYTFPAYIKETLEKIYDEFIFQRQ